MDWAHCKDMGIVTKDYCPACKRMYGRWKQARWRANNKELDNARAREYAHWKYHNNPDHKAKMLEYGSQRRRGLIAAPEHKDIINRIYKLAGAIGWHVDHIKPLALGGTHTPDNLQIVSPEYNMKKGSRWIDKGYSNPNWWKHTDESIPV